MDEHRVEDFHIVMDSGSCYCLVAFRFGLGENDQIPTDGQQELTTKDFSWFSEGLAGKIISLFEETVHTY